MNYKTTSQILLLTLSPLQSWRLPAHSPWRQIRKLGQKVPSQRIRTVLLFQVQLKAIAWEQSHLLQMGPQRPLRVQKRQRLALLPKYPKQLKADGGSTVPNTKKAVQGAAPQYPKKNDANGKPIEGKQMETSVPATSTVGSGAVKAQGTAPKYPGKPSTTEEKSAMADQKTSGVRAAGAAPKYPAAKAIETSGSDAAAKQVESGVSSKGVAPKFPKTN